jgi:DNA-binding beta-propeller fold protein YncE
MRRSWLTWLVAVPALVFLSEPGAGAALHAYEVVQHFKPGGEGGWDYLTVDPKARRLYFGRSTRVQVLDEDSGKLIGEISDTPGIHGVALAPELGRGFTSNGRDSSVTIFDTKTLATIKKVHIDGRNPDAILYDPVSKRVFTFNAGSGSSTVIEAASGKIVGTISLDGRPEFAVSDGHGTIFVNLEDSSAVVAFDARSLDLRSRWSIAPGEEPSGLAIDRVHHRLFSVCGNEKMVVLDATNGHIIATLPIGEGVDAAAFDPESGLVFSSNGEGTLTVIHEDTPDRFTVVGTVPTRRSARTMALDPKTHRVFVAAAAFGEAPAPTTEHPHPRPPMIPGSFEILVLE